MAAATNKRILELQILAKNIGKKLCAVLPALYHLTDVNYTSKEGTTFVLVCQDFIKAVTVRSS